MSSEAQQAGAALRRQGQVARCLVPQKRGPQTGTGSKAKPKCKLVIFEMSINLCMERSWRRAGQGLPTELWEHLGTALTCACWTSVLRPTLFPVPRKQQELAVFVLRRACTPGTPDPCLGLPSACPTLKTCVYTFVFCGAFHGKLARTGSKTGIRLGGRCFYPRATVLRHQFYAVLGTELRALCVLESVPL